MTGEKTVLRAANIGIKMQIRERKTAKNSQNLLFKSIIFRRARNGHNRSESSVTGEKLRTLKCCSSRIRILNLSQE